jgi:hypothetical protein
VSVKPWILSLAIVLGLGAGVRAAEPQISAALGKSEIYEGQSVIYQVTVENVDNPPAPELGAMGDFDVASLGQRSLDSQQITIINGVMRQVVRRGREFQYRLTPKTTGELTIPAPVLKTAGKTLTGNVLRLSVLAPSAQDLVVVELSADRQTVYPTQPLVVTVAVLVKELPPPLADRDPLSLQRSPPMLRIPWLTEKDLPAGLAPQEEWQKWIKQYVDSEGAGFGINDVGQQNMFSFFGDSNVLGFRPKPQTVVRRDAQGRDAKYLRYPFARTFTAKQVGPITLGPVTLQGTFAAGVSESGRLSGKEIYAVSKPLAIEVKDVPREGRPDNYIGAIGHFELKADLTPRQSKVGDPMTFTLALRGSGSLAAVKSPELGRMPAVAQRFKVYDATQKSEADAVRFVYSLRPLAEGDEPFPAVAVAYFDVDLQRYATIQSDPIPITITRNERLSDDQIVASPNSMGRTAKELETRREGIFANITDLSAVRDQSVHPVNWLCGLGGCLATYALVAAVTVGVRRRMRDKASLRRRAAASRARQQLQAAAAEWQTQRVREAADLIQDSLAGLVADVADLHDAGLTPKDVLQHMQAWELPPAVTARVASLLDACDAARYGGAAASRDLAAEAEEVLQAVLDTLRTQRRFR